MGKEQKSHGREWRERGARRGGAGKERGQEGKLWEKDRPPKFQNMDTPMSPNNSTLHETSSKSPRCCSYDDKTAG